MNAAILALKGKLCTRMSEQAGLCMRTHTCVLNFPSTGPVNIYHGTLLLTPSLLPLVH